MKDTDKDQQHNSASQPSATTPAAQAAKSSAPAAPDTRARAASLGMNYTFLIIYLVALSAFGSFVNDMYLPSLPEMTRFFGCSASTVQLGLTMGMIGLGGGQLLLGPLSDKYGRKPVLIWSLVVFCFGGVASVFAKSISFFLGCRLVQGLGASGGYFLARTIPTDIYNGRGLAKTMAVVGAINGFAPASAPIIGGIVSDHWGWQAVFVLLTVLAILLLCFSPRLKETLPPARRTPGSLWKAFGGYGLLIRNYRFLIHALLKGSALGLLFAYLSSAPFIMQDHFGFSETLFGCVIGINALFIAAGSMVALRFHTLKKGAVIGGIALMVATIPEALTMIFMEDFWSYELLLLPMLFSLGMIFTVGNTLAMNEGRNDAGDASALLGIMGYIFGSIVSPLVGTGNILHTSAYVFLGMAALTLVLSLLTRHIPADLDSKTA